MSRKLTMCCLMAMGLGLLTVACPSEEADDRDNDAQGEGEGEGEGEAEGSDPGDDETCGALGQACCDMGGGEYGCDTSDSICVTEFPEAGQTQCLSQCEGEFCTTKEGTDGVCYPGGNANLTLCFGGDGAAQTTCKANAICGAGAECLTQQGAATGYCFTVGCDPFKTCEGGDVCFPLVDENEQELGIGACLPME